MTNRDDEIAALEARLAALEAEAHTEQSMQAEGGERINSSVMNRVSHE